MAQDEAMQRRAARWLPAGRWLAAAYAATALAALGAAAAYTHQAGSAWPNLVVLVLFTALVVWAENVAVKLPSSAGVSASLMVTMASIAALQGRGTVLGAALIGLGGGLVRDFMRRGSLRLVLYNCAQFSLSAAAAGLAFEMVPASGLLGVLRIPVAALAYALVNIPLILAAFVVEKGERPGHVWADMYRTLPNYLAFGILGTVVGTLYSSLGAPSVVLLMTPLFIARSTFAAYLALENAHDTTIRVFLRAIEAKDPYTAGHTERVARYSTYIGEQLGLPFKRLEHLRQAALMHDLGKLAVPKHLLNKPGKLTNEEFAQVQRHAHVCIDIMAMVDFLTPMTAAAAGHHSRYDGGGYGGVGERPLEAYIVAVADAYDAMTSTRSYRKALPQDVAFQELRDKSGSQFHPDCVDALIAAIEARGEKHGAGYEQDVTEYEVAPPDAGVGSAGLGDVLPTRQPVSA